jgi:hypothetical protein
MNPREQSLFDQLAIASSDLKKQIQSHSAALAAAQEYEFKRADDFIPDRYFKPDAAISLARAKYVYDQARLDATVRGANEDMLRNQNMRDSWYVQECDDVRVVLERATANLAEKKNAVTITALEVTAAQAHQRMLEAQVALITHK